MQSVPAPSPLPAPPRSVFLGVDVGTGSARAGLCDDHSRLLGSASSPIQIWKDGDCIEQSSTDMWHAICAAVRSARSLADVAAEEVVGPGFAAACSFSLNPYKEFAVDSVGCPVSVSLTGDARRNIIVWMDHRAVNQAEWINSHGSPVQKYCGGSLSPEMQAPKVAYPKSNDMICGFTLDTSEKQLALLYLATIHGFAYGTCRIVEHCTSHGHRIDTLLACGGLSKTRCMFKNMQILSASIHPSLSLCTVQTIQTLNSLSTGCSVILPRENESVLFGSAILGAVAAKKYPTLHEAMKALNAAWQVVCPSKDPRVKKFYDGKYQFFRSLYEHQLSYRSIMTQASVEMQASVEL